MTFTVFDPDEMRAFYNRAQDKKLALRVLADCALSTPDEVAIFLGVRSKKKTRSSEIDTQKLYKLFAAGLSDRSIAPHFGVSHTTIHNLRNKWKEKKDEAN